MFEILIAIIMTKSVRGIIIGILLKMEVLSLYIYIFTNIFRKNVFDIATLETKFSENDIQILTRVPLSTIYE